MHVRFRSTSLSPCRLRASFVACVALIGVVATACQSQSTCETIYWVRLEALPASYPVNTQVWLCLNNQDTCAVGFVEDLGSSSILIGYTGRAMAAKTATLTLQLRTGSKEEEVFLRRTATAESTPVSGCRAYGVRFDGEELLPDFVPPAHTVR